jgi:hypothetical protein
MEAADKVRKAAPADLPQISTALSRAFFDDPCLRERSRTTSGDSHCCPSSSRCSPGRSCATTRATPALETWSQPPCGRRPVGSRSAARTPTELGRRIEALAGPTRPASWGSTSCSTTTIRTGPTGTCSSSGSPGLAWPGHRLGLDGAGAGAVRPRGARAYLDAASERNKRLNGCRASGARVHVRPAAARRASRTQRSWG